MTTSEDAPLSAFKAWRERLAPWLVPIVLLIAWELLSRSGTLSARILPEPWAVVLSFGRLAESGELWEDVSISAWRAVVGLVLGGGSGLVLGLLSGSLKSAETLFDSSIQMLRNIPSLALLPLVILWLGIGEATKEVIIAIGVFFPIYINTFHGIRSVDRNLIEMGGSYGLSGWTLYRDVILPGAMPSILVGVRYALGHMWISLIVAETVASQSGIGYMILNAREFLLTDIVLVGILLYAILGKLADLATKWLERRLLSWHSAYQRPAAP
jgi:sulfonate transport system permease protein